MSSLAKVYSNIRGLQSAVKDAGRLREIVRVLVKHGFGALVTRLGLTEVIGVRGLMEYHDEADVPYSIARRIRLAAEELGPTFIKLGQVLSTRSDLLPPDVLVELQHFQSNVPPMPWESVAIQVERELGKPPDQAFRSFERGCIAAASIAQAHRAVLPDGTPVVVKVKRPGIERRIDSDLNILEFLARRAARMVPELALMDPEGMVAEFEKALRKELDFASERDHIRRFQKNFAGIANVRIPRVFDSHSGRQILAMEYIEGVKCIDAPAELGVDPSAVARGILGVLMQMIFEDGFFHGDLHPGNILVDASGTVGLVDFGLAGRLSTSQRDQLVDILIGVAQEDYDLVARTFFEVGIKVPGVSYDFQAFQNDTVELMERHIAGKALSEIEIGAFFTDLVGGAVRHQLRMPPAYTMVFKALVTCEGVGKTLAPDLNLIDEAMPFVGRILAERYSVRRLFQRAVRMVTEFSSLASTLPGVVNQLLREIEQGRFVLQADLRNLTALVEQQERSARLVSRAVLVGACLLSGTAALAIPGTSLLGIDLLALAFYGTAIVLGRPLIGLALRGD